MFRYALLFLFVFFPLFAEEVLLKEKEPNFRAVIIENDEEGNPLHIRYDAVTSDGQKPVKEIFLYSDGRTKEERDLLALSSERVVIDGADISFHRNGKIASVKHYQKGALEGEVRNYYFSAALESVYHYKEGKREGAYTLYYPNGNKKEEGLFVKDQLDGDRVSYDEDESKAALIPYENGLAEGKGFFWNSKTKGGALNCLMLFKGGLLHGDGKTAARQAFNEKGEMIESEDFRMGRAVGWHMRYYDDGTLAYRLFYVDGKREGKEEFYNTDGKSLGGGLFRASVPCGEHLLFYPNGQLKRRAHYNDQGVLLEPIVEHYESGKIAQKFSLAGDALDGSYQEWNEEGKLIVSKNYAKGDFEGCQEEYGASGQIRKRAHYQHGVLVSSYEEWHENGALKVSARYVAGELDGEYRVFDESGKLIEIVGYSAGKRSGLAKSFFADGSLRFQANYVEGHPEGKLVSYYEGGVLKQESFFVNGKREGKERFFHANGNLKSESTYHEDLLEGLSSLYYEDGSKNKLLNYANGICEGDHFEYFPKEQGGGVSRHYHFEKGIVHGKQLAFYPSAQVACEINYDHGALSGKRVKYDEKGCITEEGTFERGLLEGLFSQRTMEGEKVVTTYKGGKKMGLHEVYFPPNANNQEVKRLKCTFKDDLLDGELTEYDEDGVKRVLTPYVKGRKEGKAVLYAPDGELLATVEYRNDKRHGKAITIYPQGRIAQELCYADDKKQGEEKTYFSNGQLATHYFYDQDKLHGHGQEFSEEGVLLFEGDYVQGKKHGTINKYNEEGSLNVSMQYENDKLIKRLP